MNEKPVPLHDDESFLIRLKEIDMSEEDYEKEKLEQNHKLVKDARGKIFQLAWLRGEYLRSKNGNKEYPIVARVQERQDGDFDLLNIVREPVKLTQRLKNWWRKKMLHKAQGGK